MRRRARCLPGLAAAWLLGCGTAAHPAARRAQGVPAAAPVAIGDPRRVPPGPTAVMMQGFYWKVPRKTPAGSWWQNLAAKAPELAAAGITAMWIPPPYKGYAGVEDAGYGVYDRYDLGEFDQRGAAATRYGTLAELLAAVRALHDAGIAVHGDIVMNHMIGGDGVETVELLSGGTESLHTRFDFPGRKGAYSTFRWDKNRFNGSNEGGSFRQWHAWDFAPYEGGDAHDDLLGTEIRYADPEVRAELVAWGRWITAKLGLDGYRLDAIKHIDLRFVNQWLDEVKGDRFAVSEAWTGDVAQLQDYARLTGGRTHLFDVPLHDLFHRMSLGHGAWDMRALSRAGFAGARPDLAVTFVDNHDTVNAGPLHSPVDDLKMLAYAYVLARPSVPCLFYRDWYELGLGPRIAALVAVRRAHAFGPEREYAESDAGVYLYAREGDAGHAGMVLLLNDGPAAAQRTFATPFASAALVESTGQVPGTVTTDPSGRGTLSVPARGYAVWVPAPR